MGQSTYLEMLAEADRLREEAEKTRLREVPTIAKEVAAKLNQYRISLSELEAAGYKHAGIPSAGYTTNPKPAEKKRPPVVAKYQDPTAPERVWSGRGISPSWVREHIEKGGKKEDLLIK